MTHRNNRILLNDGWRFHFDNDDWQAIALPHSWNALDTMNTDTDAHYRRGVGTYEREFVPPVDAKNRRLWLEFEAVSQRAKVYFDDVQIGEHHGGYTRFIVEVPNQKGVIRVEADNTPDIDLIPSDMSDFFLYGGITRNVWLFHTGDIQIEKLHCRPHIVKKKGHITLSGQLSDFDDEDILLSVTLMPKTNGTMLVQQQFEVKSQDFEFELDPIRHPQLWSPKSPFLYHVHISISVNGGLSDLVEDFIGFREFDFPEHGAFYLNGERLLLRGTHRHEDWAGYGSAVPDELTRKEFALIKEAGFNFVRLGHYPQSRATLEACDELGLIVWEEVPWCRGGVGGETFKQYARQMLHEMIDQHFNHTSIVFWGMGNELDWDYEHPDSTDEKVIDFLIELNTLSHQLDPSRLTALRRLGLNCDAVDVYSPSIWAGWYSGQYTDYERNLETALKQVPRLLHAEWGGDSHVGRHNAGPHIRVDVQSSQANAEVVGTATSDSGFGRYSKDGDWSESYILDLMEWHLRVQADFPNLAGTLQWAFKDFGTPLRPENPVPYVNQKGVIDRAGRKKDIFYLFKAYQTSDPVCHIESNHWAIRPANVTHKIRVYSNQPSVELFINGISHGKKYRDPKQFPACGYVWEVTLIEGIVVLRAESEKLTHTVKCQASPIGTIATDFQVVTEHLADTIQVAVQLIDANGHPVQSDERRVTFKNDTTANLIKYQGYLGGSDVVETANGRAWVQLPLEDTQKISITVNGLEAKTLTSNDS